MSLSFAVISFNFALLVTFNVSQILPESLESFHNSPGWLGDKVCTTATRTPDASEVFLRLVRSVVVDEPMSTSLTGDAPQHVRKLFSSCFLKLTTRSLSTFAIRLFRSFTSRNVLVGSSVSAGERTCVHNVDKQLRSG